MGILFMSITVLFTEATARRVIGSGSQAFRGYARTFAIHIS